MPVETRLDILRTQAEAMQADLPQDVATRPAIYAPPDSEPLQALAAAFPIGKVVEFAAEQHRRDPKELSAMAIQLQPAPSRRNMGGLEAEPAVHEDGIHYPVISIATSANGLKRYADSTLRHELRHIFQPNTTPLYTNRLACGIVQAAGLLATPVCTIEVAKHHGTIISGPNVLSLGVSAAVLAVSGACALSGHMALWIASRQEIDAGLFAYRTRSFQPFRQGT